MEAEGEGFEPSMDEKTPITVFETLVPGKNFLQTGTFSRPWVRL